MNKLSLLLVEDNMDDEWLALRTLKKLGIERVKVVRDGYSAVSTLCGGLWQGEPFEPDLVLLDMKLPMMDGIEVLRRLKTGAGTSAVNVVLLTSSEDPHALETCRRLGVIECLQKPLTVESLLPILECLPKRTQSKPNDHSWPPPPPMATALV